VCSGIQSMVGNTAKLTVNFGNPLLQLHEPHGLLVNTLIL